MIFLILLFSITANAQNYFPLGKVGANTTYTDGSMCEKIEQTKCWEVSKIDASLAKVGDVDDLSKPLYIKENINKCKDKDDCQLVLEAHVCAHGNALINEDYTEVYCAVLTGYEQKQDVVLDPVKVAEKEAKEVAEQAKKNDRLSKLEALKANGNKDMKDLIEILGL